MTDRIYRPTYLIEDLGEQGRLPDGAIVNIGGTSGPYFTVGGKALMFADGSVSGPVVGGINLQNTYDNGNGSINLSTAKNFVINAINGNKFTIDAATGHVTIDGDLSVLGQSNVIEGTVSNLDQVNIGLPNTTTIGLTLQPNIGITPTVDLVQIRNVYNSPQPVFKIDAAGATTVSNLYVTSGLINGISLQTLADHLDGNVSPPKHSASQIGYAQGANTAVVGATVQAALDSIESTIASFSASDVQGFEYVQLLASDTWTIVHSLNSKRMTVTVWDENDEMVLADKVKILTNNSIQVLFNTPQIGRAILMIF